MPNHTPFITAAHSVFDINSITVFGIQMLSERLTTSFGLAGVLASYIDQSIDEFKKSVLKYST